MALKGVVFDFDGVLADTERLHLAAYQHVLAERGLTLATETYYRRYLGYDDVGVLQAATADAGMNVDSSAVAQLVEAKCRRFEALLDGADVLFAGAARCVRSLSDTLPLAIASGALRHEIERILSAARLRSHFQAIVGADDVQHSKPAPDAYRQAVRRLLPAGTAPPWSSFVAVEDSRWGLQSARAAGLRTIGITHTYPATDLADADVVVETLGSIDCALLERLCA